MRLGADETVLPSTLGERVSDDEKPSIHTGAVYQELDAVAIERLKKIREDGLAQALAEEKAEEAEQLGEIETDGETEGATGTPVEKTTTAPESATVASAPSPIVSASATTPAAANPVVPASPAAPVSSPTQSSPSSPSPPSVFPDDPNLTLEFGNGAALPLRSVYVPNDRIRR
jgi:hypothetical protein